MLPSHGSPVSSHETSNAGLQDNLVPLSHLVPPLQQLTAEGLRKAALQALTPVSVDGERQFYISLRYGIFVNKEALLEVLKGTHSLQAQFR